MSLFRKGSSARLPISVLPMCAKTTRVGCDGTRERFCKRGSAMMIDKMNPVIHFEMPAQDRQRVRKFYEKAFGWQTQEMGPDEGNFVLAFTTDTDENRTPKQVEPSM